MMLRYLISFVRFNFTPWYSSFTTPSIFLFLVKSKTSVFSELIDSPFVLHQLSTTRETSYIRSVTVLRSLPWITIARSSHKLVLYTPRHSVSEASCERPYTTVEVISLLLGGSPSQLLLPHYHSGKLWNYMIYKIFHLIISFKLTDRNYMCVYMEMYIYIGILCLRRDPYIYCATRDPLKISKLWEYINRLLAI